MKPTDEVTLSREARSLIDDVRDADDPSDADRARVKRALMATIAGGAGLAASTAASSAAASAAGTAGLSVAAKVAAVVLVFGAIGGTVALTTGPSVSEPESHAEARPARTSAPATRGRGLAPMHVEPALDPEPAIEAEPAIEEAAEVPSEVDAPAPAATADGPASANAQRMEASTATTARRSPAVVRAPRPAVEPIVAPSTLAEEVGLLRRAQGAIRAGDPDAALASLAEHARRFPTGAMAEEREAARVVALCRADRRDEARAAAARFLATRAESPLATRVRTACE